VIGKEQYVADSFVMFALIRDITSVSVKRRLKHLALINPMICLDANIFALKST
jgi:hypothetical protein